ncbi:methyl-accepting chemotaxis protein [Helicobacter cetorum]|uniref:methyl-accepting chemotaxis protein n=1 Tax=Helicobacter cetorum TaxID=138563 RepID=UPI0013152F09|nr:methyl-accepting chemotaxis protein [Helicobacter cetorum]
MSSNLDSKSTKSIGTQLLFVLIALAILIIFVVFFLYRYNQNMLLSALNNQSSVRTDNNARGFLKSGADLILLNIKQIYDSNLSLKENREHIIESAASINELKGQIYLVIADTNGVVLFDSSVPESVGKNYSNVASVDGVYYVREYLENAKKGGGYVKYSKAKLAGTKPQPKIAYAFLEKNTQMVIAVTAYYSDLDKNYATNKAQVQELMNKTTISFLTEIISLLVLVFGVALFVVYAGVVKRASIMVKNVNNLSEGDRDLSLKLQESARNDELNQMAVGINTFIERIRTFMIGAKENSLSNLNSSNQLNKSAHLAEEGIAETSHRLQGLVAFFEQTNEKLKALANNSGQNISDLESSKVSTQNSQKSLGNLANQVEKSAQTERDLGSKIEILNQSTQNVKSVLDIIDNIAKQTNLLALNAAIEAARAGEHGRGFAVVADEVRKLAENTQKSLNEISTTIQMLTQEIADINSVMNANVETMEKLSLLSNDTMNQFDEVVTTLENVVGVISDGIQGQISITKEIANATKNVESISNIAKENASHLDEIVKVAESLHKNTALLDSKIKEYRT